MGRYLFFFFFFFSFFSLLKEKHRSDIKRDAAMNLSSLIRRYVDMSIRIS